MPTTRLPLRAALLAPALALCLAGSPARAQNPSRQAEIEALQKKVAAQDQRIAALEREVNALLAARDPRKSSPAAGAAKPAAATASTAVTAAAPQPSTPSRASTSEPVAAAQRTLSDLESRGVKLGGDVYLFQYVPFGVPGARPKFELYALSLQLQGKRGPWSFYSDYRFRTTKLRSYYPGNTWLQQAYVGYQTPVGQIRAGSFYRRVGLFWDDSFFGNIQYFDGLKLDPEFGLGFEGAHRLSGRLGAEYSAQYFSTDAGVNGSLPGRDFVSEPGAHAKNDGTVRFAPVWHFSEQTSLTVGSSYAYGTIGRDNGPHNSREQYAVDATLAVHGLSAYAEVLDQKVGGVIIAPPQDATYSLIGAHWNRGRIRPRFNYSNANYHGFNPRREYILQPGVTVDMTRGFLFLYEFDYWRRISTAQPLLIDKSLNFVLQYHF